MTADAHTTDRDTVTDPEIMQALMGIFGGRADPTPAFALLREARPVASIPELNLWVVSRHQDCVTMLRDDDNFGSMPNDMMCEVPEELRDDLPDGYPAWFPGLVNTDPPVHDRIRKLAQKPITRRMVLEREASIRAVAESLVDQFVDQRRTDIVSAFALPLPITVLGEILGVPPEDQGDFQRWAQHGTELFNPSIPAQRRLELSREQVAFGRYVAEAIRTRRENPADDLISMLVGAEEEGERSLTDKEIHGCISHIVLGGFDSTAGAICFALNHICSDRQLYQRIRSDLGLVPQAVEETVRRSTSVRGVVREAKADVEIGGVTIPRGARVMALLASANQDPAKFDCPHAFDIDREPAELRKHIGFGQGIHKCIGQSIAQLEIRVAVETLLSRLPEIRVVTEDIALSPGIIFLRPSVLEVEWDAV